MLIYWQNLLYSKYFKNKPIIRVKNIGVIYHVRKFCLTVNILRQGRMKNSKQSFPAFFKF